MAALRVLCWALIFILQFTKEFIYTVGEKCVRLL